MNTQLNDDASIKAKMLLRMKSKHEILAAELDDAASYESFMSSMFAEDLETLIPRAAEPTLEQVSSWLSRHVGGDCSVLFLAVQSGLLIGSVNLTQFSRPQADHIVGLGLNVRRGYRDLGIGRALMQQAVNWFAEASRIERLELEVTSNNAAAIHLYKSFGFALEGVKRCAVKKPAQYLDIYTMALMKQIG
jgi:RimJ/RimL family protein N-acetyltransferase